MCDYVFKDETFKVINTDSLLASLMVRGLSLELPRSERAHAIQESAGLTLCDLRFKFRFTSETLTGGNLLTF